MRFKYKGIYHKKGTLGMYFYDNLKDRVVAPVVQFSLKEPWWIPKLDKEYFQKIGCKQKKNGHGFLIGWIFIYAGICISERNRSV